MLGEEILKKSPDWVGAGKPNSANMRHCGSCRAKKTGFKSRVKRVFRSVTLIELDESIHLSVGEIVPREVSTSTHSVRLFGSFLVRLRARLRLLRQHQSGDYQL
jgi:hypothetical protein